MLLPLVEHLARDNEAEIRAAVVKQLQSLGACRQLCVQGDCRPAPHVPPLGLLGGSRRPIHTASITHNPDTVSTLHACMHARAGEALYQRDAERSMRDIESTLLVCAQQCALDVDDEVRACCCCCCWEGR